MKKNFYLTFCMPQKNFGENAFLIFSNFVQKDHIESLTMCNIVTLPKIFLPFFLVAIEFYFVTVQNFPIEWFFLFSAISHHFVRLRTSVC